jgi:hypothetical protein
LVALPWDLYQRISDGLEKAFRAGAAHHIFKGEPDTNHGFILQNTVVYPAPFVKWAYHNYLGIPEGLSPLLPEAVKQKHGPAVYSENLVSAPAESEDPLPERPDEKAPPERWATLFRAYKKIAKCRELLKQNDLPILPQFKSKLRD